MEDKQKEFDLEVLKWILGGYFRAEKKLQSLENRLAIISDKKYHAGIAQLSDMPKSPSPDASNVLEETLIREEALRSKIERQKVRILQNMKTTTDMIDFLPDGSLWQQVTELYHIGIPGQFGPMDMMDISEYLYKSERQCYRIYRDALQILMNTPEARFMIQYNREAYRNYITMKPRKNSSGRTKNQSGGANIQDGSENSESEPGNI